MNLKNKNKNKLHKHLNFNKKITKPNNNNQAKLT